MRGTDALNDNYIQINLTFVSVLDFFIHCDLKSQLERRTGAQSDLWWHP